MEPCDLSASSKRLPPGPDCQSIPPHIFETGQQIIRFHDEGTVFDHRQLANPPAREIQMKSAHDVDPGPVFEHPKIRTDPRIQVEELVLAIPLVEAIIDVHDAGIANGSQQRLTLPVERFVLNGRA